MSDKMRGSGRTTSGMLKAIAHALDNPGQWVPFTDHSGQSNEHYAKQLRQMADLLCLRMTVNHRDGYDIAIRSDVNR